jgi:tetratricopeptide (TPR) repeat protein
MPKTEHVELAQFVDQAMAEYRRRAADDPDDAETRSRINFLLKHGQDRRAIESIHEFAAQYPHDWLDDVLAFVVDAPADPAASQRLDAWAGLENDFTSWLYAAYAHAEIGDWDGAERCVSKALESNVEDPRWGRYNARAKGLPLCLRLCRAGRFSACEKLCKALLKYSGTGSTFGPELKYIQDLAQRRVKPSTRPSEEPPGLLKGCDPFENLDLARLKAASSSAHPSKNK